MKTKLILIGGVPGTGKTTIAYHLALTLKIDKVLSTDMIKLFTKTYCKNYDKYLYTTTHEAYKLENLSIIDGYLKHSKVINDQVLKVLDNIKDKVIIIEGSTLNRDLLNIIDKDKYEFVYLNLTLPIEDLKKRYKLKSKLRKSNWLENITIIEEISNYLLKDNINILNNDIDKTLERIIKYVKENLYI